jgi:3-deoxy-D-manno-octulosonic-acid transferase
MKFDTAQVAERIPGDAELAAAVGLRSAAGWAIWVCGSTGPGEEEIVLRVYRDLFADWPKLRLAIVPRHPERFDAVAELIQTEGFATRRRSQAGISDLKSPISNLKSEISGSESLPPVVLGDTMGELRKFYSLADVVFVGRSLVDLGPRQHGSDMIEPAALAKPVVVGPWTHNFAEPMNRLRDADAVRIAADPADLRRHLSALLSDPGAAAAMGRRAQDVVRREQGATGRHVEVILEALAAVRPAVADTRP